MALELNGVVVINNSRELQNCANTDSITNLSIADALRNGDDFIEIQDSSGNTLHKVYGTS